MDSSPMDQMPPPLVGENPQHQLSRALQTLLRHRAEATGVQTSSGGWARYDDVLALPWVRGAGANPDILDSLVANRWSPLAPGQFQRAVINGHNCIRATRGHTMGHIRLEDVGERVLSTDPGQRRTLYHFVSLSSWQSGNHEKGLFPPGPCHKVVMLSPSPDLVGPGRRTYRNTVVIAVATAAIHRLNLPVYRTYEGDMMVGGPVPPLTWLWADHHAPDGSRTRIWNGEAETEGVAGALDSPPPPGASQRAAGARRAAGRAASQSPDRTRSSGRPPPPPADEPGRRSRTAARAARTPPRARRASGARSRSAAAVPASGSPGPSPSTYSESASSPPVRSEAVATRGSANSMGSRGSGSAGRPGRGIYASGRSHTRLPAHDRRASRDPSRHGPGLRSSARRSGSPPPTGRAVVMTAPRSGGVRAVKPERYWAPPVPGRSALLSRPAGRPAVEGRPKPSGAPRRVRAVSRERRGRRGHHRG